MANRNGTEKEEWKTLDGYDYAYQVSSLGRVARPGIKIVRSNGYAYSEDRVLLKQSIRKDIPYYILIKDGKMRYKRAGQLVASAFLPNPNGRKSLHYKDGNQCNIRLDNLVWQDSQDANLGMCGEVWKDIDGYEGMYEVSSVGRVRSVDRVIRGRLLRGKILRQKENKGYMCVSLCKAGKYGYIKVHQCVCRAFIPNPMGLGDINHKNGIRDDNRVENLEWCTRQYNIWHSYHINNRNPSGSKPVFCVENNKTYPSCLAASRDLGIDNSSISMVAEGKYRQIRGFHFQFIK